MNVRGLGFRGRCRLALYLVFAAFLSGCAQLQTKPGLPAIGGEPGAQAQPGKFVFHELLNDDPARAEAFYGELFGWRFQDQGDGYSLIEAADLDDALAKAKGCPDTRENTQGRRFFVPVRFELVRVFAAAARRRWPARPPAARFSFDGLPRVRAAALGLAPGFTARA